MDAFVALVFQRYVPPPIAVKVAELPLHMVLSGPALAVGGLLTKTVTLSESVQPVTDEVTVTVYVVVVAGLTV